MNYTRWTNKEMHQLLYQRTERRRKKHKAIVDPHENTNVQALFCPYYTTLDGVLGADWGVILNPISKNFGKLVFEHDWCGCPVEMHDDGEWFPTHGCGNQGTDEWLER